MVSKSSAERKVISLALKWMKNPTAANAYLLRSAAAWLDLLNQPLHTVEPIPCGVYANHSATMFCVLPVGHEGGDPGESRFRFTRHAGYPGGAPNNGPNGGLRWFYHSTYYETMETHERAACPRFPGCSRHPEREAKG